MRKFREKMRKYYSIDVGVNFFEKFEMRRMPDSSYEIYMRLDDDPHSRADVRRSKSSGFCGL